MQEMSGAVFSVDSENLGSVALNRDVKIDLYVPPASDLPPALLLINDGQNLEEMGLLAILSDLYGRDLIQPLLAVGIHAGELRKREYGVMAEPDYLGRGDMAGTYQSFILTELLPYIHEKFPFDFSQRGFAGFSLGGLSALDIVWCHPTVFQTAAVFSGSLWWRSVPQELAIDRKSVV